MSDIKEKNHLQGSLAGTNTQTRIAIISNPNSGKGKAASATKYLERLLERRRFAPVIHYTNSPERSRMLANHISFRYKKLIVIGGDSTINEVINGIVGSECKIGIVPTGVTNVLALELGIPVDIEKASAIAIDGEEKKIDLGKVNKNYFSILCAVGFDAENVSEIKPIVKNIFHTGNYSLTTAREVVKNKPEHLLVKIDDNVLSEGYFAIIANSKYYKGSFSIAKKVDLSDGYLDICIFKNSSSMDFLKNIASIANGKNVASRSVEYYRAKDIKIESAKPVLIQTDGDVIGETPAKICVAPKKLTVMVPRT